MGEAACFPVTWPGRRAAGVLSNDSHFSGLLMPERLNGLEHFQIVNCHFFSTIINFRELACLSYSLGQLQEVGCTKYLVGLRQLRLAFDLEGIGVGTESNRA